MVSEDQVRALFKNANPVPDLGLVSPDEIGSTERLEAILERGDDRDVEQEEPKVDSRRLTPWLVAALVVVVIGTAALLSRPEPVDTPVATDPTMSTPTTSQTQLIDAAVANVEAFISAFNARDAAAISQLTPYYFPFTWSISETEVASVHDLLFAMDTRWEVVEPCAPSADDPYVIACTISVTDRFFGPGGLDHTSTFVFGLGELGQITSWRDLGCCDRQSDYVNAFWAWLSTAHPDIYADINPAGHLNVPEALPGWADQPSKMTTALQYADEFVQATHRVFPEGEYRAERSTEDLLAAGMPEADVPDHAGTWTLTFRDGALTIVDTAGGQCDGTYSVEDGRVSLVFGQGVWCGTSQGQVLFSAAWEDTGPGIRFLDLRGDDDPTEQATRNAIFSDVVWTKIG